MTEQFLANEEQRKAQDITLLNIRFNERSLRLKNLERDVSKIQDTINDHD